MFFFLVCFFQDSFIDDSVVLMDSTTCDTHQNTTPIQSSKRRAVSRSTSNASPSPSISSKTSETMNLKEMAVDALRSMGQTQPKDKFSALGEYFAAELRSLTPQQAEYAKSRLSRAFNDIVDEAIQKVCTVFLNILM